MELNVKLVTIGTAGKVSNKRFRGWEDLCDNQISEWRV